MPQGMNNLYGIPIMLKESVGNRHNVNEPLH